MFRWIDRIITRNRAEHAREQALAEATLAFAEAEQARLSALAAVRDAKTRGDTRDLGAAYKRVRAATHSELRLVVGR